MKVLVIGAGGVFGYRLAEGLVRAGFAVVAAGRDLARAEAVAARLRAGFPQAEIGARALDARTLTPDDLRATGAGIVADAAGPFQGAEPVVARAAIAAGLHYVDLADGRDFVAAFPALDAEAKAAGVAALTGCSSTPALSHAVLEALTQGWREIVSVEAAISPGARAPRGLSVMQAILSWLGRPVRVFQDGGWKMRRGWSGLYRRDFGVAGRRRVSLCETPDLDLLAERFQPRERALFLAGLEPGVLHRAAWLLAWATEVVGGSARGLAKPLLVLARLFAPFGSDRGAMRVEALGVDADGRFTRAVWRLVADPGAGPVTPSLPALAAIKAIAAGTTAPGARACVGVLPLEALEAEIARHPIQTTTERRRCLFAEAIGPQFDTLPDPIRTLHETPGRSLWRGEARTEGADNPLGGLLGALFGFPGAQATSLAEVRIDADGERSVWERRIGTGRFTSVLSNPRPGGRVSERFGPLSMELRLRPEDGRLHYEMVGWRLGPLPLPRFLAPLTTTHERVDDQWRFVFDVEIGAPMIGRLVRYQGWLVRVEREPVTG